MRQAIVPIVEGHSEIGSVPVLLRDRVVRPGELEKALTFACRSRPDVAAVLVILDADDDCPAELGSKLAQRCQEATPLPALVVLASRELEGWLLGAKESLRGVRGIRADSVAPQNPEGIRGAKERLSKNMAGNRRYLEVDDQPALVERMDFALAQDRCPSFARFVTRFEALVSRLASGLDDS